MDSRTGMVDLDREDSRKLEGSRTRERGRAIPGVATMDSRSGMVDLDREDSRTQEGNDREVGQHNKVEYFIGPAEKPPSLQCYDEADNLTSNVHPFRKRGKDPYAFFHHALLGSTALFGPQ